MFRNLMSALAICVLAFSFGCAGTVYESQKQLPNGGTLTHFGRTGAFGTDGYGGVYEPPAPRTQQEKVQLEKTYHRSETSWENCSDKTPNKNAKKVHRSEKEERWTEEVLPENGKASGPIAIGGTNPSTGNLAVPALFGAMGQIGAGMATGGTSIAVGGAKIVGSGNSKSSSKGGNSNSEINNSGNSKSNSEINNSGNSTSKSISNSGSFSNSSSDANAKAIADQTTIQKTNIDMSQKTGVGVEVGR